MYFMENNITYITGGQRSGKSHFAKSLAEKASDRPVYLATAKVWDEDFAMRIAHHKSERGNHWQTIEETLHIHKLNLKGQTVVLDCVTLWLTNIFHKNGFDVQKSLQEARDIWSQFIHTEMQLFVVSNELGMGIHGADEASRKFTDLQGWMNQYIAAHAHKAYLMVSGIAVQLK
jgi:adenosylcobinamide kinase / adenosylcobinamide-phosphate guanylyltransferase